VHESSLSASLATRTLSEADSKALLAPFGVIFAKEAKVATAEEAVVAAREMGGDVVVKLGGDSIAHKTERGLVRLRLSGDDAVRQAAQDLLAAARPEDGEVHLLIAEMVSGVREFIVGMLVDAQFGPTVMLGVGGIMAEALKDVVFRPAPTDDDMAAAMIDGLRTSALLDAFRGEAAVNREQLVRTIRGLSDCVQTHPDIASIDINPLIVRPDGSVVAVDALVERTTGGEPSYVRQGSQRKPYGDDQFKAFFEPRGVVVAGASTHPGKFGFVSLHNILASGYRGQVFGTNLQAENVLGVQTVADVADLPSDAIDLVFVCTPASTNQALLTACAAKGVKAAFLTSAGYGEAGDEGRAAEQELVAHADQLGMLMAGPNGQGVVSTPVSLCAQIVAPYPPAGGISIASQSGNFVSSFMNYARQTGVGVCRAVSAGNAAALGVADLVEWYGRDDKTKVSLAYVEGITDGRSLMERLGAVATSKPVVIVKGGATEKGARAAASHTGALAANDSVFDGACRAHGITRASTVEEAYEAAASFATQPLPRGPRVVVLTTAGGWGVVTSDAIARDGLLELLALPADLLQQIDTKLPPRWSRNNPVDCAGGETRDTIPEVMEMIAKHESVDAIVYLGLGIQANQGRLMKEGPFYPDHGLERIVTYHERQDARFAEAAHELSLVTGKPILVATELAIADPENAGVQAVRRSGRLCYPSGNRAVTALGHLYRYALHTGFATQ
jgi:acyl-CoA synthetase (NDP forming)